MIQTLKKNVHCNKISKKSRPDNLHRYLDEHELKTIFYLKLITINNTYFSIIILTVSFCRSWPNG